MKIETFQDIVILVLASFVARVVWGILAAVSFLVVFFPITFMMVIMEPSLIWLVARIFFVGGFLTGGLHKFGIE